LTDAEQSALGALFGQLTDVQSINAKRARYYDSKQVTRHLGISIPPQLESVETVIGWPAKAVDSLERRTDLDGFVVPDASVEDLGIDLIMADNRLLVEAPQAHRSAYKYGPAFVAVLRGGPGEPEVLMRTLSAATSTVLWDGNRRRAAWGLTLLATDLGQPTEFILYGPERVVTARREDSRWLTEDSANPLGRCPVATLPFLPSLESPLGRSRISQAVMSITDRAVRSLLRMEVSAEFYSSPQRYILGADESSFTGPNGEARTGWETVLSKVLAISTNEDDEKPTVGQFQQLTMQPHMEMVRSDAALFAGETDIPVNALGIIHDNPASDAAMHTAFLELNKTAERAHDTLGAGWVEAMQMAVMVRDGLSEVPDELRLMRARFRNPATPTRSAAADAVTKLVQAGILPADSDVTLEMAGFDRTEIQRIQADRRRSEGKVRIGQIVQEARAQVQGVTPVGDSGAGPVIQGG
jgi:hypothetical protein